MSSRLFISILVKKVWRDSCKKAGSIILGDIKNYIVDGISDFIANKIVPPELEEEKTKENQV